MTSDLKGPILIVCADEGLATSILEGLFDEGLSAIGPASTAGLALALAAQTTIRTAIIAGGTTGRRTASELAVELRRTWGVDCYVLERPEDCQPTPDDASGRVEPGGPASSRPSLTAMPPRAC